MDLIPTLELSPVDSSQISKVGYSEEHKVLAVEFNTGTLYYYKDVPKEMHEKMLKADSVGRFLNQQIKGDYEYERII